MQASNPQLRLIYTDKHGVQLEFVAVAAKKGGSALGTLFAKVFSAKQKHWMGKIGDSRGLLERLQGGYVIRYNLEEINIDAILEKVATDLYAELGSGKFSVPKTRLAVLPLINQFGPDGPRWPMGDVLFRFIKSHNTQHSVRIMSKYIAGYMDFNKAETLDPDDNKVSFIHFIKTYHRPPDHLVEPKSGKSVPLHGLMELIAVGRMLADTDLLGGSADNAGFVWKSEDSVIVSAHAVKIDPGKALSVDCKQETTMPDKGNWVINTYYQLQDCAKLADLRDIQITLNAPDAKEDRKMILWEALTPHQKHTFLGILFNATRYLKTPDVLKYLIYRDGKFQYLPEEVAQKIQDDMQTWIELQLKIYDEDFQTLYCAPIETVKKSVETLTIFNALLQATPITAPDHMETTAEVLILLLKEMKSYGENARIMDGIDRALDIVLSRLNFQEISQRGHREFFFCQSYWMDRDLQERIKEYSESRRVLSTGITTLSLPTVDSMCERLEQLKTERLPKLQEIVNTNAQKRWTYQRWVSYGLGVTAARILLESNPHEGPGDIISRFTLGALVFGVREAVNYVSGWNTSVVDPATYEHPTDSEYNEIIRKPAEAFKRLK